LAIYTALNKLFNSQNLTTANLKISVVIAAKNEATGIGTLISALQKQDYPQANFEVIIIDDNSNDNTATIVNNLLNDLPNFHLIKAKEKIYAGKRGALHLGINKAKHPHILITDADCIPQKQWISAFAGKFNEGYDFVFGIAPYYPTNSITNLIAQFENLRAQIIMFAFAYLGLPYSAAARSFGFSKKAFKKIKGFRNTTETLSGDDDLLLREAIKHNFKIGLVVAKEAFVFSNTKENFTDFSNQKARHTSSSHHYSIKARLLLGIWHILNLVSFVSVFLFPLGVIFILPFIIKIIIDAFILNNFQNDFSYKINPLYFIFLQIIYELSIIYFFIKSFRFANKWE
jgi:glycosyltransferase involved in cell wall biosynthesis